MPIEIICTICGRKHLVPPSRASRLTCSKPCQTELKRRRGYSPALRAAVAKRRETDGDPEVRRRRYGNRRGSTRTADERRRTSETLREFHHQRGMTEIGNKRINANGYVIVLCSSDPSGRTSKRRATDGAVWRYLHDVIMEGILGRALVGDEVVHHRDGDRQNNDPENLELTTNSEHSKYHATIRWKNGTFR